MSDANDDQQYVSQVADGSGGAIYAWDDHRNGSDYDIYAHHLFSNGSSVVGINELAFSEQVKAVCFPNPISTNSIIELIDEKANHPWEISIFDAFGNLIETQSLKGNESYGINASKFSAGIYFYNIIIKETSSYSKGSFISAN